MAHSVATPVVLTDPGMLWIAPLGTADPTNTVAGSVFTDDPAAAFVPLGATSEGSEFSYSTTVEAVKVAEPLNCVQVTAVVSRVPPALTVQVHPVSPWVEPSSAKVNAETSSAQALASSARAQAPAAQT